MDNRVPYMPTDEEIKERMNVRMWLFDFIGEAIKHEEKQHYKK